MATPTSSSTTATSSSCPTAEQLAALGVRHVLYVSADATQELDDLNAALVAICQKGIDVKMVALGDFVRADDEPQVAQNEGGDEGEEGEGDEGGAAVDPAWAWRFAWAHPAWWWPHFWYRGCWWNGGTFWGDYGFYQPSHGRGMSSAHHRGAIVVGPPSGTRTPAMPTHAAWSPTVRNTMFTPLAGVRHSSFGTVEVRATRNDGRIIGMRAGSTNTTSLGARAGGVGGPFARRRQQRLPFERRRRLPHARRHRWRRRRLPSDGQLQRRQLRRRQLRRRWRRSGWIGRAGTSGFGGGGG